MPDQQITSFRQKDTRFKSVGLDHPVEMTEKILRLLLFHISAHNDGIITPVEKIFLLQEVGSRVVNEWTCIFMYIFQWNPGGSQLRQLAVVMHISKILMNRLLAAFPEGEALDERWWCAE